MSEPPQPGGYTVTLPTFEGPLDLLLHLCQKHELDILDIPIGFVTEKYLEYLAVMQLMSLDVASEYLVMAATLAHIKSKMLLPAPPPGQEDELAAEEEDPRESLIRRLLEYQKYKQAGEDLASRGVAGRDVFMRGMPIEEAVHTGLPPLAQVPLFSLVEAFQNVLSKSKISLSHDIVHERVTLADRINELVDVLRERRRIQFEELFEGLETRFDLVITFLALLEMTRLRMTRLFQENFESPIIIEFTAQVTADDGETSTSTSTSTDAAAGAAGEDATALGAADGQSSLDTEPPPARMTFDEMLANGGLADEVVSSLDTEAPPPSVDGAAPVGEWDEDATSPLHTIPAPASMETSSAADEGEEPAFETESDADPDARASMADAFEGDPLDDDGRSTLIDVPTHEDMAEAAGDAPEGTSATFEERSTLFDVPAEEDTLDSDGTNAVVESEGAGEEASTTSTGGSDGGETAPSGDEDT